MVGRIIELIRLHSQRRSIIMSHGAVLHNTARIINNLGDTGAISIGRFSHIKGELLTFGHGGKIVVGQYCYIGEDTRIWSAKSIAIGDRVLISHNVNIFDNITHPLSPKARHEQFKDIITKGHPRNLDLDERPIMICDDALIGCMSIILRGITIGKGAVIGAGSVVTNDVPPYIIVAGNPARKVGEVPLENR